MSKPDEKAPEAPKEEKSVLVNGMKPKLAKAKAEALANSKKGEAKKKKA